MAETRKSRDLGVALGLAVFALALILRIVGLGWGLKTPERMQSLHPDEAVVYAYSQAIQPAQLQFDPGFYNYGTLYLTVIRITSDVVASYTGAPDPKNETSVWDFVSRVHFAGRCISALAGAGTVLAVFLMTRRHFGDFGAVAASILLAVSPGHVVHSRFQTVDILATFFLTVSAAFALRLIPSLEKEDEHAAPKDLLKWAALAGVFAGLSAGTKYTGILALFVLGVVLLLRRRECFGTLIGAAVGSALLVFVLSTPGILLHTSKFMEDFGYEMAHTSTGHGLVFIGTVNGFLYHLVVNLFIGIGPLPVLLGIAGLVYFSIKKEPWALALIAFFILTYVLIGRAEVKFLRYTFPLYPMLAIGFGAAMAECHRRQGYWAAGIVLGIVGLGGFPFGGITLSSLFSGWMTSTDPRDQAATYLKEVGAGKTVGLVSDPWYYTPPLYPLTGQARVIPGSTMIGIASPTTRRNALALANNPQVIQSLPPGEDPFAWDVRLLDAKPDFIVYSAYESQDLDRIQNLTGLAPDVQVQVDRYKAFVKRLDSEYKQDRIYGIEGSFMVHDLQYIRPPVYIWRRKP
ncbi:MAG: ArnT family glycosyltransferase [Fimbriimonas sp.]